MSHRGGATIDELYDEEKFQALCKEIKEAHVAKDIEDFLIWAATRHIKFNYSKIADYYAEAPANIQKLMEDSALVIIDFNKAIELGYVRVSRELSTIQMEGDYE